MGLKFLGKLPLDPKVGRCCDEGKSFLAENPDSQAAQAYKGIVQQIMDHCTGIPSLQHATID